MKLLGFQQPSALRRWAHGRGLIAALLAASLGARAAAESAGSSEHVSRGGVEFSAAVNWDFHRRPKLDAWQNTAVVIRRTLSEWYPPQVRGLAIENGDHTAFRGFFDHLAKAAPENWSVVYLASHQSPGGRWYYPNDSPQSWSEMLPGTAAPSKGSRFVIIDACFAEAADSAVVTHGMSATRVLYASTRSEVAHELNFRERFPIDLPRQYPAEAKWLKDTLGTTWNGRVSFLGFIWLRAFLATPHAPESLADWDAFFHVCESQAGAFRHGRGEGLASTVRPVIRDEPRP